ncbi:leucine-rich repeat domain-containing protein [Skeletonema marinoi]|uniref:Leucine-rich repeat domain-containing protein n=1 Tax=Skeletonema marinoi TaxID=267567 RepID=A0AAD8YI23_9STRA|nr:leucine-rich repeat domain-containing protein [Skeletonema marinoi]
MERLATLYLGGNEISYVDARNLKKNVPNLNTVIMTGNGVKGWNVLSDLGEGCPKLEYLSLVGNPITSGDSILSKNNVTNKENRRTFRLALSFALSFLFCFVYKLHLGRQHYRLYTIHKIPTLKVLDFQKVKQSERERAQRLAASAAGAAMEADCRLEARAAASSAADDGATNTFEPGEGKNAEESFATQFTLEEKAQIREMVANAASAEEIDRIENLVKKGIFPGKTDNSGSIPPPPPPPPPPSEDQDNEPSKRQKTDS